MVQGQSAPSRRTLALPCSDAGERRPLPTLQQGPSSVRPGESAGAGSPNRSSEGENDIAKYVEKTQPELAWDNIRREVQYRCQLAATTWRLNKLNEILPKIQAEFEEALARGVVLELQSADTSWLKDLLVEADA